MVKQKMTRTNAESQAYVWYDRVTINEDLAKSPWIVLNENDVVTLRSYNTEKMKDGEIRVCSYEEVS